MDGTDLDAPLMPNATSSIKPNTKPDGLPEQLTATSALKNNSTETRRSQSKKRSRNLARDDRMHFVTPLNRGSPTPQSVTLATCSSTWPVQYERPLRTDKRKSPVEETPPNPDKLLDNFSLIRMHVMPLQRVSRLTRSSIHGNRPNNAVAVPEAQWV